ncbi:unnamed protein product [Orchesella dallaii]|uniref:Mpv17-like protein n=1 Tax=Orchesella dallaii TaxID=48710 RepID=A0ABP1PS01_9HEXA
MGRISSFFARHPFLKASTAYAILWPTANIVHQIRSGKEKIDTQAVLRYGAAGVTWVCPVFYCWVRGINYLIPGTNLMTCYKKVICEQVFYWPVAIAIFFGSMSFYNGESFEHFKQEFKSKYFRTHMTGLCFWPFVSLLVNYSNLVKDQNRIPLAAVASFGWASFLSYIQSQNSESAKVDTPTTAPTV